MDEPLSNLDAKLRVQMRAELIKLHKQLGTTTIYVTHDQIEAMTMASRIVVMKDGWIQQVGAPKDIYDNPTNVFVGGFIGTPAMNFVTGRVNKDGVFETENTRLKVPAEKVALLKEKGYIDKDVILGIRPEHISDLEEKMNDKDAAKLDVDVEVSELLGAETNLHFLIDEVSFVAKIGARADLKMGDKITLGFDMAKAHFFDPDTEKRITEESPKRGQQIEMAEEAEEAPVEDAPAEEAQE